MGKHVFIMQLSASNKDWKEYLERALSQLCEEINGSIFIFELNEEGVKKAEALLR